MLLVGDSRVRLQTWDAVRSLDYPLIQGLFLTITLAVLGANFLVDIIYVWLDPRARRGAK